MLSDTYRLARRLAKIELAHWKAAPSMVPVPELDRSAPEDKRKIAFGTLQAAASSQHVLRLRRRKAFCVVCRRSKPAGCMRAWSSFPCRGAAGYAQSLQPSPSGLDVAAAYPPVSRQRPRVRDVLDS